MCARYEQFGLEDARLCVLGEVLGLIVSGGVRNSCFCSPDVGGEGPFQIWNSGDWDLELVG